MTQISTGQIADAIQNAYQEGFVDALNWVLEHFDLTPEDSDYIQEILDD